MKETMNLFTEKDKDQLIDDINHAIRTPRLQRIDFHFQANVGETPTLDVCYRQFVHKFEEEEKFQDWGEEND